MHRFESTVRLHHTDAAGVIYFARLFDIVHEAFEDLLDSLGHPLPEDLAAADVALPLVRAEADYRAPLRLGQRIVVEVSVARVRDRAFSLTYRVVRADGVLAATAGTVHVAVGDGVRRAARLPAELKAALEKEMDR